MNIEAFVKEASTLGLDLKRGQTTEIHMVLKRRHDEDENNEIAISVELFKGGSRFNWATQTFDEEEQRGDV